MQANTDLYYIGKRKTDMYGPFHWKLIAEWEQLGLINGFVYQTEAAGLGSVKELVAKKGVPIGIEKRVKAFEAREQRPEPASEGQMESLRMLGFPRIETSIDSEVAAYIQNRLQMSSEQIDQDSDIRTSLSPEAAPRSSLGNRPAPFLPPPDILENEEAEGSGNPAMKVIVVLVLLGLIGGGVYYGWSQSKADVPADPGSGETSTTPDLDATEIAGPQPIEEVGPTEDGVVTEANAADPSGAETVGSTSQESEAIDVGVSGVEENLEEMAPVESGITVEAETAETEISANSGPDDAAPVEEPAALTPEEVAITSPDGEVELPLPSTTPVPETGPDPVNVPQTEDAPVNRPPEPVEPASEDSDELEDTSRKLDESQTAGEISEEATKENPAEGQTEESNAVEDQMDETLSDLGPDEEPSLKPEADDDETESKTVEFPDFKPPF